MKHRGQPRVGSFDAMAEQAKYKCCTDLSCFNCGAPGGCGPCGAGPCGAGPCGSKNDDKWEMARIWVWFLLIFTAALYALSICAGLDRCGVAQTDGNIAAFAVVGTATLCLAAFLTIFSVDDR